MNRATVLVLLGGLALTAAFIFAPGAAATGPFVPKSGAEVLEVVPKSAPRPSAPLTADEAAQRTGELLEDARRSGEDPRLLGRAQATLAPWWNEAAPPPRIRFLRATLKQRLHDFEGALADLEQPADAQGWFTRAQLLTTLGRYPEAEESCAQILGVDATLCRGRPVGIQGRAKEALEGLPAGLPVRGELEHWLGDDARAVATLEQALTVDPFDTPSRVLLAQIELDQGQPGRAVKLFEKRVLSDGELVMLVLALSAVKSPEYPARRAELDERIAANRQRGESLSRREESRYALALEGDAGKALELATKNWAVQKEPADARVLLEAAVAAKDAKAAAPVLEWLAQTHFSEPRVLALAKALR